MEPSNLDSPKMPEPYQSIGFDEEGNRSRISRLRDKGVNVWGSERVYISADVSLDRLEAGAILFNAVLRGEHTSIGRNSRIGESGQVVITNSQIGADVELGAGVYVEATVLDHVKTRGFAEIRSGSLLEEQVEIGHNVGLKNTILTSAVVAGSCINFCDVFMTGGTSRSDHSEIGSGTVHFNFDPRGDKFGSLIGDARGVLLRFPRIFVGGNVGLVGPIQLTFGSVIPAGMTIRHDIDGYARSSAGHDPAERDFDPEIYFDLRRKFITTAKLTGNLHSLLAWYRLVRGPCTVGAEKFCCEAAEHRIMTHIRHRVAEIERVIGKLDRSLRKTSQLTGLRGQFNAQHRRLVNARDSILSILLRNGIDSPTPLELIAEYGALRTSQPHVAAVRGLSKQSVGAAAEWLLEIGSWSATNIAKLFE